jgi:3-oxoacyl-[acyl-carrier-protein] synthase III
MSNSIDSWPRSRIKGTGSYVPARVVTNDDLAKLVDTSDEWIRKRVGIRERRYAAEGETSSDMAAEAARRALAAAQMNPDDLDMIIVGTITGDMPLPACAVFIQRKLGCREIPAFDVAAACAGFIFALSTGDSFIRSGAARNVLVIGVETLTRITNFDDRNTCVLFGDGAGAAVLSRVENADDGLLLSTNISTDGTQSDILQIPAGGSKEPLTHEGLDARRNKVFMNGQEVFKVAVRRLTSASQACMQLAGLTPEQIDWVVPHQANLRILNQIAARLGIPYERFVLNIENRGNTSSASVPIALNEAILDGRIKHGNTVLMCALGGGISWGSALVRI